MLRLLTFLFLAAAAAVSADRADGPGPPTAAGILDRAVKAQGGVKREEIEDIHVRFRGQIQSEDRETHTFTRDYWYRARDRAFRMRTRATASNAVRSELGVYADKTGKEVFWEQVRRSGGVLRLSARNRDDRTSIKTIRHERERFESLLRMVLLSRLVDGKTSVRLGAPAPVRLVRDMPYEARAILGADRTGTTYHVLDLERPGEPRMRLFVSTADYTVRKAIQYDRRAPREATDFFYFGPYPAAGKMPAGPRVPYYFSVHSALPTDEASKAATCRARGSIRVEINRRLSVSTFVPAAG